MIKQFNFAKASKVHNNFYDYSKVSYKNMNTKVIITCPKHGDFLQSPKCHINRGQGCQKCQYESYKIKFSFTEAQFIKNAKSVHGNKYDYSQIKYVNSQSKVTIICPRHGQFSQLPLNHVNHGKGCPKCKGEHLSLKNRLTLNQFIKRAKSIHGNKYDYSQTQYCNMHQIINIICPKHGIFPIEASNHIYSKNGCPKCGYNVSKPELEWLDSLNIPEHMRQKILTINGTRYKVDAYDKHNKIIYEYFGYFWHGHPDYFNPTDINPKNKKTFGELYSNTLNKINNIQNAGFQLICKWG